MNTISSLNARDASTEPWWDLLALAGKVRICLVEQAAH